LLEVLTISGVEDSGGTTCFVDSGEEETRLNDPFFLGGLSKCRLVEFLSNVDGILSISLSVLARSMVGTPPAPAGDDEVE
jgi:hypothetical protein